MNRLPQEIIRAKRDGQPLAPEDVKSFVEAASMHRVSDAQIAAFAMAVFFNGMTRTETIALTEAMRDSGKVLDWSGLEKPVVDKHSTGGIGDNVSLVLAPIVAACGAAVPMISGRGLGHTGGTLDKLEAIPGYTVEPDHERFRRTVTEVGCAIVAATDDFAPADKRIYAIRDVTATVESVPMIVASILSKKLAEGLDGLVLDVKAGSGAFMATAEEARALAHDLVGVAQGAGLQASALLTRMDDALASAAGNALEVENAVRFLTGEQRDPALAEITLGLAAEMLVLAGLSEDGESALAKAQRVLDTGAATDVFARMVASLDGPVDFVDRMDAYLPKASVVHPVEAPIDGYVRGVDGRRIGLAVIELGGGRRLASDKIDASVGFSGLVPIGAALQKGDPIAFVHAANETEAQKAVQTLLAAYEFYEEPILRLGSRIIQRIA